jgi:hypothetical protein
MNALDSKKTATATFYLASVDQVATQHPSPIGGSKEAITQLSFRSGLPQEAVGRHGASGPP